MIKKFKNVAIIAIAIITSALAFIFLRTKFFNEKRAQVLEKNKSVIKKTKETMKKHEKIISDSHNTYGDIINGGR